MKKIVYYCSWGGFGHIARAYSISKFLDNFKVYVCSAQPWVFEPMHDLHHLLLSEPSCRIRFEDQRLIKQNYKEGGEISEYTEHLQQFFAYLEKVKPDLVIIDNPAELALMTKMMGYKTFVVYETLKTQDFRWKITWGNVDKVLVPYPKIFADDCGFEFKDQAFFAGGFSRFEESKKLTEDQKALLSDTLRLDPEKKTVFLTFGKGGLGRDIFEKVTALLKNIDVNVLFANFSKDKWSEDLGKKNPNLKLIYGKTDLFPYYEISDFVISGAGYNSVMEPMESGKPAIFIPLERIYGEQINKARTIERIGAGCLIDVQKSNWLEELSSSIDEMIKLDHESERKIVQKQKQIVDGHGAQRTAKFIEEFVNG